MPDLIEILESFNRKERFFLLAQALGHKSKEGDAKFALDAEFRDELSRQLNIDIPCNAFVAMDYHLDWLHASLIYFENGQEEPLVLQNYEPFDGKQCSVVKGTQEDADLLIAFRPDGRNEYHIVLVEAKAYSGWTNTQLKSKAKRLKQIFGDNGERYRLVRPHFCLMGPNQSKGLDTHYLPPWMKPQGEPPWLELYLPENRLRVVRKDKSNECYVKYRIFNESLSRRRDI